MESNIDEEILNNMKNKCYESLVAQTKQANKYLTEMCESGNYERLRVVFAIMDSIEKEYKRIDALDSLLEL